MQPAGHRRQGVCLQLRGVRPGRGAQLDGQRHLGIQLS
jgi:hypothetical protein